MSLPSSQVSLKVIAQALMGMMKKNVGQSLLEPSLRVVLMERC